MKRNAQLDSLRAVSILLVLIAHLGFQHVIPGGLGVTIFFGISGYIISILILKEHEDFGNVNLFLFYKRRFWKIAPPLFFLVMIPSMFFWKTYSITISTFLSQIFFIFNWNKIYGDSGNYFPPSGLVWSLSIEEQFYIGIALFVLIIRIVASKPKYFRKIFTSLMCATWLLSTVSRILITMQDLPSFAYDDTGNLTRIYFGTDTRISSIACGSLVALLSTSEYLRGEPFKILSKYRFLAFQATILIFLISLLVRDQFFRDTFRFSLQEIGVALLIITGPVLNSWPKNLTRASNSSVVQLIGKSSYSLYLSHGSILLAMSKIFHSVESQINPYLWRALTGISCLYLGYVAHRCFDSPFEKRRISARRVS
jgi:peptidoglycan/LPS O-acetylase OafA/YrhL